MPDAQRRVSAPGRSEAAEDAGDRDLDHDALRVRPRHPVALGVAPLITGIIGRVFGLTHFNTLYGIVFLSHQVGSFFGAWMGGVVFTYAGNYNFAWGALIVIGVAAFTLQWLMDERPPRERAGTPAPMPASASRTLAIRSS